MKDFLDTIDEYIKYKLLYENLPDHKDWTEEHQTIHNTFITLPDKCKKELNKLTAHSHPTTKTNTI